MDTILVFGGNPERLDKGIELALSKPKSRIIVSATAKSIVEKKVKDAGIDLKRLTCVYTGYDTLTELTSTRELVKQLRTKNLYLVSDHWHMQRITTAADIVYFWQGIKLIAVPVYGKNAHRSESQAMINADRKRALLWRTTGRVFLGDNVKQRIEKIQALEHK
jgi:hypothetical protein